MRSKRAIVIISSSDISPLKRFNPYRMNRQFLGTYPRDGIIRSMLGEYDRPPGLPVRSMSKVIPVNSHFPVHLDAAHSRVSENGTFFFAALPAADARSVIHG